MGELALMRKSSQKSSKMRKKILIVFGAIFLLLIAKFVVGTIKLSPVLWQLIFNKEINLKKADDNINILLLGIGGGKHEGPNLTDSIIFASLDPQKNSVKLISIPRDLWISDIKDKINAAYAIGEDKKKGGGIILTRAIVSKITNQPVDYVIRLDFAGFIKAIDLVGGLDINNENTFDDYEYPIEGKEEDLCGHPLEEIDLLATASSQLEAFPCRYKHIRFDRGLLHIDGQTALEFVRSRHAQGEEGTDFARSKRQEKVIQAFKNQVLSAQTLLNPVKIISLYTAFSTSIDTDIQQSEFDDFVRLLEKMKGAKIQSAVLDYGDEEKNRPGLLMNPPISKDYNGTWVLIPRIGNDNFSEIQKYISCELKTSNCQISKTP